jgi:osmotically-inducible protein OsmY
VVGVDNDLVVGKPSSVGDSAKNAVHETGTEVADTWITAKVKSTYLYSSNVDGNDISVSTERGVVTLSGKVDGGAERALAVELAKNVRGVKSVNSKALTAG